MDPTTLTVGDPYDGESVYIPGLDTRERIIITNVNVDPDGTPTMDMDVWDEATQSYTTHTGIRWESGA